jgi:hypothetical protein
MPDITIMGIITWIQKYIFFVFIIISSISIFFIILNLLLNRFGIIKSKKVKKVVFIITSIPVVLFFIIVLYITFLPILLSYLG